MWDTISAHKKLTAHLEKAGVENPRVVSETLLAHLLGIRRIDIYTRFDVPITEEKLKEINPLVKQIEKGVPLQLVVGDTQFLSYILNVEAGVFIPRPETEVLVDAAARMIKKAAPAGVENPGMEILDIGTGTGAIAVSLLKLLPGSNATAIDINPAALALTQRNAEKLGVADRLKTLNGNLLEPVSTLKEHFTLIISNPPYIPTADIEALDPAVKNHDPRAALDGGKDGLDIVRNIISQSQPLLKPGGLLAFEIGAGQAQQTAKLMEAASLAQITIEKDLSGIDRCVFGWKK